MLIVIFLFIFSSLLYSQEQQSAKISPYQWTLLGDSPASISWMPEMADVDMSNVYIILPDTGGCPEHTDMSPLYWSLNIFTYTEDVTDTYGHGCAGSSIIGARGIGMMGLARSANLIVIKALNPNGPGDTLDTTNAIYEAIKKAKEIKLVNPKARFIMGLSFGRPTLEADYTLDTAAQTAVDEGVIVVIAAGNEGDNLDDARYSPHANGAIVVCATDKDGRLADESNWKSNYGKQSVFICAPGVDVFVTAMLQPLAPKGGQPLSPEESRPYSGYAFSKGASIAQPFVTGAIALLLSQNIEITLDEIKENLDRCGKPMENGEQFSITGKTLGLCPITK